MRSLNQFIDGRMADHPDFRRSSEYVRHPDFSGLYVRVYLASETRSESSKHMTIVIANIAARKPGSGSWRRLIRSLRARYRLTPILVECVRNDDFAKHLMAHGWRHPNKIPDFDFHDTFWLMPEDPNPYAKKPKRVSDSPA
mgnify:CR=1 FL=1